MPVALHHHDSRKHFHLIELFPEQYRDDIKVAFLVTMGTVGLSLFLMLIQHH